MANRASTSAACTPIAPSVSFHGKARLFSDSPQQAATMTTSPRQALKVQDAEHGIDGLPHTGATPASVATFERECAPGRKSLGSRAITPP